MEQSKYDDLKQSIHDGETVKGARIFPRNDLDMIEPYDPDIDAIGYVSTKVMSEKVSIKLSEVTRL